MKRILLASPTIHGEEKNYIKEAFDRNWIAPLGFNCDCFEKEIAGYLGGNTYAFATISGTSAIHLAVKLAGVKTGDHVLCSDLTFSATVNPVSYEGGVQVFIDSEKDTWNMSPEALEKAFEKYPDARVVILVHLYGTPAKMDKIMEICNRHHAILIEDAAEALSATYKGTQCGLFGKYGVLSFNGNKIITTSGGGMLLSRREEDRDKAVFWSAQAKENAPWYQHTELGYNYRMSNVVAGIGRGQLKHIEEHRELKRHIYFRYKEGFRDIPVAMNSFAEDSEPNYWLSVITVNAGAMCMQKRTDTTTTWVHEKGKSCPDEIESTLAENNIESRPIWKPMHLQPYYADRDFIGTGCSEDIFNRGLCLPSDIKMTKDEQDRVIEIVRKCFE